jgi:hypothetical protein
VAEVKPMKIEIEGVKPAFRPAHLMAGFFWLNFAGLIWVVLFDLIPEGVGVSVGAMAVIFFLLAMGASMVGYEKGEK